MSKYFSNIHLLNIYIFKIRFYTEGHYVFEISFTNFLLFALPIGMIMLLICWLCLQLLYNRRE